jgi:hypothetical protein
VIPPPMALVRSQPSRTFCTCVADR